MLKAVLWSSSLAPPIAGLEISPIRQMIEEVDSLSAQAEVKDHV